MREWKNFFVVIKLLSAHGRLWFIVCRTIQQRPRWDHCVLFILPVAAIANCCIDSDCIDCQSSFLLKNYHSGCLLDSLLLLLHVFGHRCWLLGSIKLHVCGGVLCMRRYHMLVKVEWRIVRNKLNFICMRVYIFSDLWVGLIIISLIGWIVWLVANFEVVGSTAVVNPFGHFVKRERERSDHRDGKFN